MNENIFLASVWAILGVVVIVLVGRVTHCEEDKHATVLKCQTTACEIVFCGSEMCRSAVGKNRETK